MPRRSERIYASLRRHHYACILYQIVKMKKFARASERIVRSPAVTLFFQRKKGASVFFSPRNHPYATSFRAFLRNVLETFARNYRGGNFGVATFTGVEDFFFPRVPVAPQVFSDFFRGLGEAENEKVEYFGIYVCGRNLSPATA